jgi:hypothetical protein
VAGSLRHSVPDGAAFDALRADVATHGALILPYSEAPVLNDDLDVVLLAPGGHVLAGVRGRVVHLQPDDRAVILLDDAAVEQVLDAVFPSVHDAIHAVLAEAGEVDDFAEDLADVLDELHDSDEDEAVEDDDDGSADESAEGDKGAPSLDTSGQAPLWAQYAQMHKRDKLKLAKFGNADARRVVLKDRDQSLHIHVLANPGLTAKELSSIIRNKQASPALLKRVLERTDFMSNISVVEALVFNPHTPLREAEKLVAKVSMDAARRITKAQNLRAPIVRAARRRVHARARGDR